MPLTGNQQKPTRFRGPTVITLRGAGSQGNDYKFGGTVSPGAGADVGLDIQVPAAQSANCFQITKPDGTVVFKIGPYLQQLITAISANSAVAVTPSSTYVVTKAGVCAMTLAAPTATTHDGVTITITSNTANAHTLTATGLLQTGSASVNVATFAAQAGAGLTLIAYQGKWNVLSSTGITFS
jgi:hypothetical protein